MSSIQYSSIQYVAGADLETVRHNVPESWILRSETGPTWELPPTPIRVVTHVKYVTRVDQLHGVGASTVLHIVLAGKMTKALEEIEGFADGRGFEIRYIKQPIKKVHDRKSLDFSSLSDAISKVMDARTSTLGGDPWDQLNKTYADRIQQLTKQMERDQLKALAEAASQRGKERELSAREIFYGAGLDGGKSALHGARSDAVWRNWLSKKI